MDFYEMLDRVLDLLRRRGRVSYRALKRHFDLDDGVPEDLKTEIFKAQRLAVDEDGWFTEGFDTADLQEARALLTDLSAPG